MIKTMKPIEESNDVLLPPDPERVMEGLRDTGYNFNTALADIIDNSVAADATKIDISVDMDPRGEVTVYIADNGTGMDEDGLKNAMRYGSKQREDPSSLGKFGLGLKTSSTAFCRCLSVISRGAGDDSVRKVQWDLDYIAQTNEWNLKQQIPSVDEVEMLDATAEGGTGTVVVWEKIDRLLKKYHNMGSARNALKKITSDLQFHISMVYQRFLDPSDDRARNVQISLNGIQIQAWDPFCISEPDTEKLCDEIIDAEMEGEEEAKTFTIRAFMLPRRENFSTSQAREDARLSNDRQGFYIYRENRLIHAGEWLGMFSKEPHFSLLRVEFSFDHTLDDLFNVDIKKSRILLNEEIFTYVQNQIMPAPRRAAEDRYRKGTTKDIVKKARDAHEASNKNIDEKASSVEESRVTVTGKDEVKLENQHGVFTHKITIRSAAKAGQYRVIPVDSIDDGQLWNPCIVDGKHAVELNQSHPYYQKIYYPILAQNVMVTGMDALLWALAEAELSTFNAETKEQYEDMRIHVSRCLKKLISDLPDPEPEDDEE